MIICSSQRPNAYLCVVVCVLFSYVGLLASVYETVPETSRLIVSAIIGFGACFLLQVSAESRMLMRYVESKLDRYDMYRHPIHTMDMFLFVTVCNVVTGVLLVTLWEMLRCQLGPPRCHFESALIIGALGAFIGTVRIQHMTARPKFAG
jgi:hypothetical protein